MRARAGGTAAADGLDDRLESTPATVSVKWPDATTFVPMEVPCSIDGSRWKPVLFCVASLASALAAPAGTRVSGVLATKPGAAGG